MQSGRIAWADRRPATQIASPAFGDVRARRGRMRSSAGTPTGLELDLWIVAEAVAAPAALPGRKRSSSETGLGALQGRWPRGERDVRGLAESGRHDCGVDRSASSAQGTGKN